MYIPDGYGTVFPYMIVEGAEELVDFLCKAFGATVEGKTIFPNGRIANIRMRIGTSSFMMSQAGDETMNAMPASYYLYVEDVDTTYEAAIKHGAQKVFEPADMPYKERQAGVVDPSGNTWWISRRLVEEAYDA